MLASVIVGILCAVMGTYVVLRGMAFLGDALAHAILPGIAIPAIKADLGYGIDVRSFAVTVSIAGGG